MIFCWRKVDDGRTALVYRRNVVTQFWDVRTIERKIKLKYWWVRLPVNKHNNIHKNLPLHPHGSTKKLKPQLLNVAFS